MYFLFMETSNNTRKTFLKTTGLLIVASAAGLLGKIFVARPSVGGGRTLRAEVAPGAVPRPGNRV